MIISEDLNGGREGQRERERENDCHSYSNFIIQGDWGLRNLNHTLKINAHINANHTNY